MRGDAEDKTITVIVNRGGAIESEVRPALEDQSTEVA
jgi:hypothetical protein